MKKKFQFINVRTTLFRILFLVVATLVLNACDKATPVVDTPDPDDNIIDYPVEVNTIIATSQLRALHTGQDITLTKENMSGAHRLAVVVTSDHSARNLPDGWLVAQDRRHQGILRGITIPMTVTEAEKYVPGDSLVIDIEGGVLTRVNGHLQLMSIPGENVVKIASRRHIPENRLSIETIAANPGTYESTFITTETALGFTPAAVQGDKLSGNKTLVRGTGQLTLTTRTDSPLADLSAPITARFSGVLSNSANGPVLHLRTATDMNVITGFDPVDPGLEKEMPAFVISAVMSDPAGTDARYNVANSQDASYEYVQFLALRDIDFSTEQFSLVLCNNAGTQVSTQSTTNVREFDYPENGWATGGTRTYKIDIFYDASAQNGTVRTVNKGDYFYVGGTGDKNEGGTGNLINGMGSNNIDDAKWVRKYDYQKTNGNGFGNATTGLIGNSGRTIGLAIFKGTDVQHDTEPMDVLFIGNLGNIDPGAMYGYRADVDGYRGYRITTTDLYPGTTENDKYFWQKDQTSENARTGNASAIENTNTVYRIEYIPTTPGGELYQLGGVYNSSTKSWTTNRARVRITPVTLADMESATATKVVD